MTRRRYVAHFGGTSDPRSVKMLRDSETREWVCRLYLNGALYPEADYFTDDKDDAIQTAQRMLKDGE